MFFTEKVALVLGGAGRIGFCVVKELLKHGVQVRFYLKILYFELIYVLQGVAIVDKRSSAGYAVLKDISKSFGNERAIFLHTDITSKSQLTEAFRKTVDTFTHLDIVINCAGFVDEVNWERSFEVLLVATIRSTVLAMREFLPKYKQGSEGIIVNTSTVLGLEASSLVPIYSVCERGIVTLGETYGTEDYYKKYKTRILTICPGYTKTPMADPSRTLKVLLIPELQRDKVQTLYSKVPQE